MKKIILIEDRHKRQELFTKELNFEFEQYTDILDNIILDNFFTLANEIIHDSFNLSKYEIIICHESVQLEENKESNSIIKSKLEEYCKNNHKTLVFFSGGISTNFYDNSEFELLKLNSKTFYSKNLPLFLDAIRNDNENILMLCYGEHWKENVVANVLEKTNVLLSKINDDVIYIKFANFVDISKISSVKYAFHNIEIDNNRTSKGEIEKFKQSLESYFIQQPLQNTKNKSLLIEHKYICNPELFDEIEKFSAMDNIDKYISEMIEKIKEKDFKIIFIKDNLSSNYLELLGLRVAYHIRLSAELGDKRFTPIVIVSDFSAEQLCKFDEMGNILFTPNIYLCKNTKEDIEKYQKLELHNVSESKYNQEFLNKIKIDQPKDYLSHHSIANEWSIYRWAEFLKVNSEACERNKSKIENMLYFKYLKAKYHIKDSDIDKTINAPTKKGKVLLIDDEWDKGWSDILKTALVKDGLDFEPFKYEYKDKTPFNLYMQIQKKIKEFDPDVVILDLRLSQDDHNEDKDLENYTGIKILQKIHEINAGIQVIMLTATSKSTILEKLYEKKILGYIKKEHPDDTTIDTVENINKLADLVDKGLERKFLKDIWAIQQKNSLILNEDIFNQYKLNTQNNKTYFNILQNENYFIFDILDSNNDNKLAYAALSMARFLEAILSIFIDEKKDVFWDGEKCPKDTVFKQLQMIIKKLDDNNDHKAKNLIDSSLNTLIYNRNKYLHANETIQFKQEDMRNWFSKLHKILEVIQNPPNLRVYNKNDLLGNLQDKFSR